MDHVYSVYNHLCPRQKSILDLLFLSESLEVEPMTTTNTKPASVVVTGRPVSPAEQRLEYRVMST